MANSSNKNAQNKRVTGKQTSARKNTGNRKKSVKKPDDTMKLLSALVIAVAAIALVIFMQKDGDTETGNKGMVTPVLTATPTPASAQTETEQPTKAPEPTESAEPTSAPEPTEEPEQPVNISPEEAMELVSEVIDGRIYKLELLNDHLAIDGTGFYQFCVSENGTDLTPFLIVDKMDGTIWYYNEDGGIEEFAGFPLDERENGETPEVTEPSREDGITAEKAYEILCTYSKEKLGLAKEVKEYTPEYDSTLTLVKGVNCYRINLTEISNGKVRNRGEFYVSTDGKQCFFIDSNLNDFVPVSK